jgi:SPP1 gp7 family putative phage head morphogenesis protein
MAWAVSAEVAEFDEAVEHFRGLVPVTDDEYKELEASQRARAFHLASMNELAVVQLVFDELDRAIQHGTPIDAFRKVMKEKLVGERAIPPSQVETMFRNATQLAYNTGRWSQITNPEVTAIRPYWMFDAVMDTRTTRLICWKLNGTIKGHDDPWWLTHYPPLHHRCRTSVRTLRRSEALRRGLTLGDPDAGPDSGFGLAPPVRGDDLPMPNRATVDESAYRVFDLRRAKDPDNTQTGEDE